MPGGRQLVIKNILFNFAIVALAALALSHPVDAQTGFVLWTDTRAGVGNAIATDSNNVYFAWYEPGVVAGQSIVMFQQYPLKLTGTCVPVPGCQFVAPGPGTVDTVTAPPSNLYPRPSI